MNKGPFSLASVIIPAVILLICFSVAIIKHLNIIDDRINEELVTVETRIIAPDSIDVIDTTEIMIDKKLFICVGDIDLDVSDVGIVSFDCQIEDKKVHIVTNPQDMFVTQYFKRVPE